MPIERSNNGEMSEEDRESIGGTALLPKTLLMGKTVSPGDKVILEVTHIYEDEIEVAYPKKEHKTPMQESNEQLESMAAPETGY